MSRTQRRVLAVVVGAFAIVVGVIIWMTMRVADASAVPIPGRGEARTVLADPSIELPYVVEAPGTAQGCPSAAFRSPVEPLTVSEGSSALMLPRGDGAALLTACIGAVDDMGSLDDTVADVWLGVGMDEATAEAWERLSIERVVSPLGDALAVTTRVGVNLLTDHYVERDGWIYAVGYLRPEAGGDADRAVVDAILASWQWR